jgi:hypothetical protein
MFRFADDAHPGTLKDRIDACIAAKQSSTATAGASAVASSASEAK